jgi:hypothetical protein
MSLDIWLARPTHVTCPNCDHKVECSGGSVDFEANITHNLNAMASAAGIYRAIWRPEECGVKTGRDLAAAIKEPIEEMKKNPDKYRAYDAKNGWGTYEHFIPWLDTLLAACNDYPDHIIGVSR